jgi:hypothetical protein
MHRSGVRIPFGPPISPLPRTPNGDEGAIVFGQAIDVNVVEREPHLVRRKHDFVHQQLEQAFFLFRRRLGIAVLEEAQCR